MPAKVTNRSSEASKMPSKLRLKIANESDLSSKVKLTTTKKEYAYHIVHSKQIEDKNYDKMMALFEPLMVEMYTNSSWGWDKQEKLSEWRHSRTRVIFVTKKDPTERGGQSIIYNVLPPEDDELVGFMCFRFETGANKSECALYVYELHIHPDSQRQGLGEELMRMSRVIATAFKMDKIMLTVFRANDIAQQFYLKKLKFQLDVSTPAKNESDYQILSSRLKY